MILAGGFPLSVKKCHEYLYLNYPLIEKNTRHSSCQTQLPLLCKAGDLEGVRGSMYVTAKPLKVGREHRIINVHPQWIGQINYATFI